MALIGTMTALLLGLLIASAKSSFDAQRSEITQMSANIIQLDRVLARYGPETYGIRAALRNVVVTSDRSWSEGASRSEWLDSAIRGGVASLYENVQELTPQNDFQRLLQSQALQMGAELGRTRSLLLEQSGSSIPRPFLAMVVFWLSIIFTSFGLLSPRNMTVVATLFVCALSVSAAIFLILELDSPFSGLLQISDAPLRSAIAHIGQ